MTDRSALLGLPAEMAARRVALEALREATSARLAEPGALHRFHAALRRLRGTLRAYGVELRPGDRRALRALLRAAGDARDASAQIGWLRARLHGARDAGMEAALERVRARAADAAERLRAEVDAFAERSGRLEKRLGRYTARLRAEPVLFRVALAERLREGADALAEALAGVSEEAHESETRPVFIAAERLSHLLHPVGEVVAGARRALAELDGIIGPLRHLHDAHLLDTEASLVDAEGTEALRRRLAAERKEQRAAFRERHPRVAERVRALADEVEGAAPGREIERKYLLNAMPSLEGLEVVSHRLDQGYIPGDRLAERVRRIHGADGTRWVRTVKLGSGVARIEVEEDTTERIFRALWRLTRGHRVHKRRYSVPHGGLVWEIDRFRDRRLVLAEVELPSEDAVVEIPEWLRPVLVREVTGEPAYVNLNLAR